MSLYLFLMGFALATQAEASPQQGTKRPKPEISCHSNFVSDPDLTPKKKELWDGYEISFGPAPNADKGVTDANCMVAIYDRSGKEVYRAADIDIVLDPATGMDIDGDGAPDVVIMKGASGGSGGSWDVVVISLKPQLHALFTYNQDFPPADFRKDPQGRVVLWSGWGGNSDLGYSLAHGNNPSARIVYRFIDGKLKDVTPEFCAEIENEKYFPRPAKASIEHFKNSKIDSGEFETLEDQRTAGRVLSLILHYVFCRQFDKALAVIHQMWPERDQAHLIQSLKSISIEDCPECPKRMERWY